MYQFFFSNINVIMIHKNNALLGNYMCQIEQIGTVMQHRN